MKSNFYQPRGTFLLKMNITTSEQKLESKIQQNLCHYFFGNMGLVKENCIVLCHLELIILGLFSMLNDFNMTHDCLINYRVVKIAS